MSRLDELLQQYCPNGVEYKPLWSVTAWDKKFQGVEKEKQAKVIDYAVLLANDLFALQQDEGDVFLLSTGSETGWTTEELAGDNLREGEVVSIPWGKAGTVNVKTVIKYYKGKFVTGDNRIMTSLDTNVLNNRFLYHVIVGPNGIDNTFYRGSGIRHPDMRRVLDLVIPVPPLAVQEEIVRVLDKFTELKAELEAELLLRKQQYEHYRDELFVFDDTVAYIPLVELAEIGTGSRNTQDAVENGEYDFYVRSPYPLKHNQYDYDDESIITAGDGVGVGKVFHLTNGKYALHQRAYRIHPKNINCLSVKYLYYFFTANFYDYITGAKYKGSVASIRLPMLQNFMVPVPSMHEQKRIVGILDRFDALCTDITAGLPAEITARQKQYEYYRDKLLSFGVTT